MAKLKVLIVDDDRDIADALGYIIKRSGYHVSVVYDGEEAINLAKMKTFNYVFMDLMLPGIDGAESLAKIRELQPDINAFIMTGYSARDTKSRALNMAEDQILRKPIMPEDILGKLGKDATATVLVADDDPIFAEIISSTLEQAGWNVRTATTGLQAVDIVSRGGISVLVLDLNMPILSGVQVCEELARRGVELPIMVATSSDDGKRQFSQHNIAGFLQKPVDPRAILEFVETNLTRTSARAA